MEPEKDIFDEWAEKREKESKSLSELFLHFSNESEIKFSRISWIGYGGIAAESKSSDSSKIFGV